MEGQGLVIDCVVRWCIVLVECPTDMDKDLTMDHGGTCLDGGQGGRDRNGTPPYTIPFPWAGDYYDLLPPQGVAGKVPVGVVRLAGVSSCQTCSLGLTGGPNA